MKKVILPALSGVFGGLIVLGAWQLMGMNEEKSHESTDSLPTQQAAAVPVNAIPVGMTTNSGALPSNFTTAAENSLESVVHVTTKGTQYYRDPFYEFFHGPGQMREYEFGGSGSGVVISDDGYLVTNHHVIEDADNIKVSLYDGREFDAEIVGTDPSTDLAVIKIKASDLRPIAWGNSDGVNVGEWVLAVGNPFNLNSTVTAGIVSAKGRNINILREQGRAMPIESFIQTDAAVNPGNSGGALVSTTGELIGINTAIASNTGSYTGYSFAVPSNLARKVTTDLIEYGIVQRALLGVQIQDMTSDLAKKVDMSQPKGVYVAGVTDMGAAKKAGIKVGDVILKVASVEVNSPAELQEEIGKRSPGEKVAITIRNSSGQNVKQVILMDSQGNTTLRTKTDLNKTTALGAVFGKAEETVLKELGADNGVMVSTLNAGKLRAAGLKEGMLLVRIDSRKVEDPEEAANILKNKAGGTLLEVRTPTGRKQYIGVGL